MSTAPSVSGGIRPAPIAAPFDVERIRRDFPILSQQIHGKPLVYLDNAATTQKPLQVIDAERDLYERYYANIHRGVHWLSVAATEAYEQAREKARDLLHAADAREIIFVRGTTEAINLVAATFGRERVHRGDEVVISALEHHSNIVPWQMLCEEKGARLRVAPIDPRGEILLDDFERTLSEKTRLVAVSHVSNALGTVTPLAEMIRLAHARGIPVLVDGAQATPHLEVDVQELDCDFYAISGHKIYGPSGVGVLYGKARWLEAMPPYQGGGDMIKSVTFEKTTYNVLPYKFEAGTPNIAGAIGLGAAIDYVKGLGLSNVRRYEDELLALGTERLRAIPGLRLIGTARRKAAVLSFTLEGVHPHDVGTVLDRLGIAVRTGHHCAQPVMDFFQVPATARASLAFYNTPGEIEALAAGIGEVQRMFA
ncbi:MAG TPA: cysteine desulfurase [Thermoanaerobaculia bacterium]|nr:cysteine desulfurase [Thermoanaerobaculia bacterium]